MRTIALIFTLALLSVVSSCNEDNGVGDIPLIYEYYHLTDSLGNDLGMTDSITSIKFLVWSKGKFHEALLDSIQLGEKKSMVLQILVSRELLISNIMEEI